jgi:TRAP-type C4-dicarboxylate transport system permease small subunit
MPAILKHAERALDALAVVLFLAMFAAILAQVFMRYVLNAPLVWTDELAQYLFVWVAFLGWALAARRRAHIAITMVTDRLPAPARLALQLFWLLALLGFAAVLLWNGVAITQDNLDVQMTSMQFGYWLVYLVVPLTALCLALYALRDIVVLLRHGRVDRKETLL